MVRALLDGTKTQTRRVMNPQPSEDWCPHAFTEVHKMASYGFKLRKGEPIVIGWGVTNRAGDEAYVSKHGQIGDRLWVKETFRDCFNDTSGRKQFEYRADESRIDADMCPVKWKPSIFCSQKASRITLEITGLCVERLNDITQTDAIAEGIDIELPIADEITGKKDFRAHYADLWETINGPGTWAANPWVWVIQFKRI